MEFIFDGLFILNELFCKTQAVNCVIADKDN